MYNETLNRLHNQLTQKENAGTRKRNQQIINQKKEQEFQQQVIPINMSRAACFFRNIRRVEVDKMFSIAEHLLEKGQKQKANNLWRSAKWKWKDIVKEADALPI